MNNKRILTFLTGISLLAVLTTIAYTATGARAAAPTLAGTWNVTVPKSAGNPETFHAQLTIFADGNMIETNAGNPTSAKPGQGVWTGSGNTYQLIFAELTFDEKGKNNGKFINHLSIKMDGPDRWNTTFSADVIDLAGKVTKKVAYGTAEGTRMKVEMP